MRTRARTDSNQAEIVAALRRAGCSVHITAQVGNGFPDLVVRTPGFSSQILLIETKSQRGKLTKPQRDFLMDFPDTLEVRSVEDALRAVGVIA